LEGPGGADRAATLFEFGNALEWVGDVPQGVSAFDQAVSIAEASGDLALVWLARVRRSALRMNTDPHGTPLEQVRAELDEARTVFEMLGDDDGLAVVWKELASIEWVPCRFDRAEVSARRAVEHARRASDVRLLQEAITYLIAAQGFGSTTPEEGLRTLDELDEDVPQSRQLECFSLVLRGFHHGMKGSIDEARRLLNAASEVSESVGLRFEMAARERLAYVELCNGNASAAERAYRLNYEILDERGDEGHKATSASSLARTLCALGRYDEAESFAEIAQTFAAEDDLDPQAFGRSARALVLAARGEFAPAEQLAREAVELYADAEAPNFQADTWMDLAKILLMAGRSGDAEQAALVALGLYERKGNRPSAASTREFIEAVT
jgi:tetratricopeptide (TPR) repeat protein